MLPESKNAVKSIGYAKVMEEPLPSEPIAPEDTAPDVDERLRTGEDRSASVCRATIVRDSAGARPERPRLGLTDGTGTDAPRPRVPCPLTLWRLPPADL